MNQAPSKRSIQTVNKIAEQRSSAVRTLGTQANKFVRKQPITEVYQDSQLIVKKSLDDLLDNAMEVVKEIERKRYSLPYTSKYVCEKASRTVKVLRVTSDPRKDEKHSLLQNVPACFEPSRPSEENRRSRVPVVAGPRREAPSQESETPPPALSRSETHYSKDGPSSPLKRRTTRLKEKLKSNLKTQLSVEIEKRVDAMTIVFADMNFEERQNWIDALTLEDAQKRIWKVAELNIMLN